MRKQSETFEQVLQESITEIIMQDTPIDEILERFPEYGEKLEPLLETAVWLNKGKHVYDPDSNFVERTLPRLLVKIMSG